MFDPLNPFETIAKTVSGDVDFNGVSIPDRALDAFVPMIRFWCKSFRQKSSSLNVSYLLAMLMGRNPNSSSTVSLAVEAANCSPTN